MLFSLGVPGDTRTVKHQRAGNVTHLLRKRERFCWVVEIGEVHFRGGEWGVLSVCFEWGIEWMK